MIANCHLGFNCKDLDKSIAFYRDIMGCKEKFTLTYRDFLGEKAQELADERWIVYMEWQEGYFIELFNTIGAVNPRIPTNQDLNYTHFAMVVEDLPAFRELLLSRGAEEYIDTGITLGCDHTWQMWMHDPDGNKFEIMQYTPKSFQLVGR